KVRFEFRSRPSSSRMLMFDHSTTNCRFGADPTVRVVTAPSDLMMRSSQNGAINDGGTAPTVPPVRVTVWAGRDAFGNSAIDGGSRLRKPFVVIEIREPA